MGDDSANTGQQRGSPGIEQQDIVYVVQHEQRDALAKHLAARGIQTVVNYPVALPFVPAYARLGHRPEDFPHAYRHQSRILSLPIFPEITEVQQRRVTDVIAGYLSQSLRKAA